MSISQSKICLQIFLLFLVGVCLLGGQASAQTVSADYNRAKNLFDKGDLKGAGRILVKLTKKYPDHQPSNILLGRVYYGVGQQAKAAKSFAKVAPEAIPSDTAFEYGVSMFAANQCSNAISGFARVPESTGLKGIADFYTGVCYMKKKDNHKAGIYLRRAKKLPPNLVSSRRRLLRALDEREKEERSGQIGQTYQTMPSLPPPPAPSIVPYYPSLPPPPDSGQIAKVDPKDKKKKAPPPPPPKTGMSFTATPGLTYFGIQKSDNNHGYRNSEATGNSLEYTLGLQLRYDGKPRDFGAQPAFTLPINIGRYSSAMKTKSTKYAAFEDAPDTVFTEVTEAEAASITTSTDGVATRSYATGESWDYSATPTGLIPLTESFDLEFKFLFKESYPHMHANQKSGAKGPSGKAIIELGSNTLNLSVGSTDSVNAKGDTVRNDLSLGAELARNWETISGKVSFTHVDSAVPGENPKAGAQLADTAAASLTKNFESFSVTGSVRQTTLTPWKEVPMAGAASTLRAELNGKMTFSWASLAATGAMTTLGDYQSLGLEHPTEVDGDNKPLKLTTVAEGTATSGVVVLKVTPLDWLSAALVYSTTSTVYTVKTPDMDAKFKAANVSETTQLTYALGVSKSF